MFNPKVIINFKYSVLYCMINNDLNTIQLSTEFYQLVFK